MIDDTAPFEGRLHFIELGSPDPERLARSYADLFGAPATRRHDGGWACRGPGRSLLFSDGAAKSLVSAGYAVTPETLAGVSLRAGDAARPAGGDGAAQFRPGAVELRDPDGNRLIFGVPAASTAQAAPDAPAARLQHLVLASVDAARAVDFYSRVIGLAVSDRVLDDEGGLRACFLRSDDEHHSFAVFQSAASRLDHHCYEVPDWNGIRDWGDRLAARHLPVRWGPGRHGPGNNLFLFFNDPDGNWVELSAELETVSPDRPIGVWRHEERTLNTWGTAFLRS